MKTINNLQENKRGQVALIVLMLASVVMTIGLSLSKKATVDTKVNINEELAKQAFNAAESGVENYLGTGSVNYVSGDSSTKASVSVENVGNGSTVNFDQFTLVNKTVPYWLVGHDSDGNVDYSNYYRGADLRMCVQSSFTGALMADYYYRDLSNNYVAKRYGFNVNADTVQGFTNLTLPLSQGVCMSNYREIPILTSLTGTPLLLIVRPIDMGTKMYLAGDGQIFPIQGELISSQGKAGEVETSREVSRTVGVLRLYDVLPFLTNSVVSWGNVLSN